MVKKSIKQTKIFKETVKKITQKNSLTYSSQNLVTKI